MSVYVEFDQWGRTGNRMFQYAFGYLLAQQKNAKLITPGLPNFNIPSTIDNTAPINPIFTHNFRNNYINVQQLLETECDIVINSYLQRAEYYSQYRETLRDVFSVKDKLSINENKLVLHVRETDYVQINCFLGYDYYSNLIKSSNFTDVIIVTDNSTCETVQRLLSDGCTLSTAGYVDTFSVTLDDRGKEDFETLLTSEHIVLSQSSFSWWAAFLGNHKTVIFPYTLREKPMWPLNPKEDDIDLYFDFGASKKFIL